MPPVPEMPPSDRVFARVDRFEVECPACGHLISPYLRRFAGEPVLPDEHAALRTTDRERQTERHVAYNPVTQRLRCPRCMKVYVVGLLLYDAPIGRHGASNIPPSDAVYDRRQLAELRRYGGAWYVRESQKGRGKRHAGDPVNLLVEEPCVCSRPDHWERECPVHGDAIGNEAVGRDSIRPTTRRARREAREAARRAQEAADLGEVERRLDAQEGGESQR